MSVSLRFAFRLIANGVTATPLGWVAERPESRSVIASAAPPAVASGVLLRLLERWSVSARVMVKKARTTVFHELSHA